MKEWIATVIRWPGSLQRMVRRRHHLASLSLPICDLPSMGQKAKSADAHIHECPAHPSLATQHEPDY